MRGCIAYGRSRQLAAVSPPLPAGVLLWPDVLTDSDIAQLRTAPLRETKRRSVSLDDLLAGRHQQSHFVASVVPRDGGRLDIRLTDSFARACAEQCRAMGKINGIVDQLRHRSDHCGRASVEWHAMYVAPRSGAQSWHVDQNAKKCYWTIIVPLTRDPVGSGTTFRHHRESTTLNPHGGVVAFRGNVEHRGAPHDSAHPRLFLYVVVTTGENWN